MEDGKIVDLFFSRDENAISAASCKYGNAIRKMAYRILGDAETAKECENDTYWEAWRRIPPDEPREYLFPYLGKIVRHKAIDECRRRDRMKRKALYCELTEEMEACIPGKESVETDAGYRLLCRDISSYLEGCPPLQRRVFVRRYWFFDSISDISQKYGCSRGNVKTMLFRMRKGLREHLEKKGYEF